MKKPINIVLALLFIASIGLNFWQAGIRRPLSPEAGNKIHAQPGAPPPGKSSFRVATYNIRRCQGEDDVGDCQRTASVLKGFDIIGLNEVGGGDLFSRANQAEELGTLLNMGWLFLPNQERYFQEHFGNGLLSTLEITRWYREQLVYDHNRSHTHRNLTTIQFYFEAQLVTLLLTHLDLGEINTEQLAYVIDKFHQFDRCILLGDFNTTAKNPHLKSLLEMDNVTDAIHAVLGPDDYQRGDWIIVKGFRVKDGGYTPIGISDHPLYWVELALE